MRQAKPAAAHQEHAQRHEIDTRAAQRAEEEIHDSRCDIAAAVIDREKAALDAEGLGDGREIEAFTAAAEAETDKDHQEACGDNDPAIPLRGDLCVLHQTPPYGASSSR